MKTTSESVDWLEDEIDPNSIPSDWDKESGTEGDKWHLSATDIKEMRSIIGKILGQLNGTKPAQHNSKNREAQIIVLRFGLDGGGIRTLEEVGKEFGVNRERIRQHEAKALRLLRHPTRIKQLEGFICYSDMKIDARADGKTHVLKTSAGVEITLSLNEETGKPTMSFDPPPPFAVALLDSIKVEFLPWFNDIRNKWMQRTGKTVELAK